ncbi:MAG: hypothetical protein H0T71_17040 [Acidobacteria bacterium]|nr:hypothetical protein [Acidobacteriota bacterium]
MPTSDSDAPEREQTDESLRLEREKSDRALAAKLDAVEADADLVVRRARETADAVLFEARAKADDKLADESGFSPHDTVTEEREIEDGALRHERAAADESLRRERLEKARALTRLLPTERDKTDRFLLIERDRSDDALANRDDFLGIVSHDLRDLLGGVVMSAELLAQSAGRGEGAPATVVETERIQRYAARMNRLIGDLLDIASIDAGKLAMTAVPGDAASLVTEAAETFQASAAAKGVVLSTDVDPALYAEFDHDRMLQVLSNLISNAIKFTAGGGHISIRGQHEADGVRIAISDTGPGIADEMLESVFERFWRVGKYDRRGLGLGLYISKCIVEAHGGSIWAESTLGEGSRFFLTFPVKAVPVTAAPS